MTDLPETGAVLRHALDERAFSAVSAEIGGINGPHWTFAAGRLALDHPTLVDASTVFDLASLTKVIATTSIALQLVERGVLDLEARVATLIEAWNRPDRNTVSVRDLLEHSAGLPAYRDYFRRLVGLDAYVATIAGERLEYAPRTRAVYSDLGFITLARVLERIGEAPLHRLFIEWKTAAGIDEPLTYRPPPDWQPRTAVTQVDPWRGRLLQGEVHDENAAALGGVATHAGLFGTAAAVGAAARWWLHQLRSDTGRQFARRSTVPGSSRALGWDTMLPTSSCGSLLSSTAVGHTGFTGTTLWIDHERDRYFVLLTNRVHVATSSDVIQRVRRAFHDTAMKELA